MRPTRFLLFKVSSFISQALCVFVFEKVFPFLFLCLVLQLVVTFFFLVLQFLPYFIFFFPTFFSTLLFSSLLLPTYFILFFLFFLFSSCFMGCAFIILTHLLAPCFAIVLLSLPTFAYFKKLVIFMCLSILGWSWTNMYH